MEKNLVSFGNKPNDLKLERWTLDNMVKEYILKEGACDTALNRYFYRKYYMRDPWFEVWFTVDSENIGLFIHDPALENHPLIQQKDSLIINDSRSYRKVSQALYRALWRVFNEPE